ncbi:MAG: hypothetical protein ACSHXH_06120 [Marivita sp.]
MPLLYQSMIQRAGDQISPAIGVPSLDMRGFMAWCLRGGMPKRPKQS